MPDAAPICTFCAGALQNGPACPYHGTRGPFSPVTDNERAELGRLRAEVERLRSEVERLRSESERQRSEAGEASMAFAESIADASIERDKLAAERDELRANVELRHGEMACAPGAPPAVKLMLNFLLTRIGSWTSSRWDQHMRERVGDEHADRVIRWLAERDIRPYIPEGTSGCALQASIRSVAHGPSPDHPIFQTPVHPWPGSPGSPECDCLPSCARCEDSAGWFHDTDGARKCVECYRRSCKVCHVSMSQHQRCMGPCGS